MKGRVHSIESMGLNDGPGIRCIVFLQGCRLRCAYCHNPDTWNMSEGELYDVEEIVAKVKRFKPYFEKSGGGITISGGEPLLQVDFLIGLLKRCKQEGIHTCLDTSGFGVGRYDEVLKYTDLVLLDIKSVTDKGYRELVRGDINELYTFIKHINEDGIKTIVRHVVLPGVNDSEESILKLDRLAESIDTLEEIELLPYHKMGLNKYEVLGLDYPLKGMEAMDDDRVEKLELIVKHRFKMTS